ncbi:MULTISPECIES: zinc-ribbon domain-containing protein [unclassified Ruminococcus]|uniref:zinc-ribbon domain-containing protein n=1 Tax=unclassified Ruminococcus TaxID=2608920 RepID=UPI00210AABD2|nr:MULTISPECIES: zinc-ribbon domain-containing protein [unclassified Ruminococcus]MCQ4022969.1 zinc-ribbon domain-containing protein [Ruminococcus sp. zg-924]MCQ4115333.1 zinc-ribbon domain-containing protein [Ruminococcus sp. zg-921]
MTCPKCGNQLADGSTFCTNCGTQLGAASPFAQQQVNQQANAPYQNQYQNQNGYAGYAPAYDPYDHTADYDVKDISENKVIAMLPYLLGIVGIIIAMLGANESPYVKFHVRQALKFTVIDALLTIVGIVLIWTIIVPIACAVMSIVFLVIKIICFVQICGGKAKEPVIIRSLPFFK